MIHLYTINRSQLGEFPVQRFTDLSRYSIIRAREARGRKGEAPITIRFRARNARQVSPGRSINQSRWNGPTLAHITVRGMARGEVGVAAVPDGGRKEPPFEVESRGCCTCTSIAQEHSPRSILSDGTQRYRNSENARGTRERGGEER